LDCSVAPRDARSDLEGGTASGTEHRISGILDLRSDLRSFVAGVGDWCVYRTVGENPPSEDGPQGFDVSALTGAAFFTGTEISGQRLLGATSFLSRPTVVA
jgi:hypothetical protein